MTLLFEPGRELPLVRFGVTFRVGRSDEPPGKDGLARLTARMLRRGSRARNAEAVENELDRLGAELSARVGIGVTTLRCETLTRSLDPTVALLAELLAEPAFAEEEVGRLKRQTVAEIVRDRDDDAGLASRALRRRIFAGHPHGLRVAGTRAGVSAVERDDVVAFHAGYVRAGAIVTISGDLDATQAAVIAEQLLSALPKGTERPYSIAEPRPIAGRRLVVIDKPDRAQTQLGIGGLGTHPSDPDHVALAVANTAFGGTFSSTLMQAIRVERGWSYGASSSLITARIREIFAMWTAPAADDAAACLALELDLLRALRGEGLDEGALDFAKSHIRAAWPFEIDTPEKRLGQKLDRVLLALPDDYHDRYLERVAAVSLHEARAAVRQRLDPDNLWIAAVGDRALRESLAGAAPDLVETAVESYDDD